MNQENEKSAGTTGTHASTGASNAEIVASATTPVVTNNQTSPEANTAEDSAAATSGHASEATESTEATSDAPIAPSNVPTVPTPTPVTVKAREGHLFVDQLRPHDENAQIYGAKESIDDLLKSIKAYGILDPLLITKDGRVIGGHRRLRVAKQLGILEVPVRVLESEDEIDILAALLEHNRHRVKSRTQIAAEAKLQMRIEKELAARRKALSAAKGVVDKLPPGHTGKSRDAVGKTFGLSGRTVEKAAETSDAIATLRKEGKTEAADKVESALNKGYDTGFQAAIKHGGIVKLKTNRQPKKLKAVVNVPAQTPNTTPSEKLPSEPSETSVSASIQHGEVASDKAMTFVDHVLTFLRSPAAKAMDPQKKRDWVKVLDQLQTCRAALKL